MDSSESPVYGEQEGAAYNGHFETVCYHPLFLFNESLYNSFSSWSSCPLAKGEGEDIKKELLTNLESLRVTGELDRRTISY